MDAPPRLSKFKEKKVVKTLKSKLRNGVFEYSVSPYANRWFTIKMLYGSLQVIQNIQKLN